MKRFYIKLGSIYLYYATHKIFVQAELMEVHWILSKKEDRFLIGIKDDAFSYVSAKLATTLERVGLKDDIVLTYKFIKPKVWLYENLLPDWLQKIIRKREVKIAQKKLSNHAKNVLPIR